MTDERLSVGRTLLAALVVVLAMSVFVLATRPITVVIIPPEREDGDDIPFDVHPDVIPLPTPETTTNAKKADDEKSHIRG